jgi:hypothetical protein
VAKIENRFIKLKSDDTPASGWLQRLVRPDQMEECCGRLAGKHLKVNACSIAAGGYREQSTKAIEPGLVNHIRVCDVGESDPTLARE